MLTLGLMEGIFAAAAMALLFFMAMEMNLPLHRIFGPPVVLIAGFIGYTVYDQGVLTSGWQVLGLLAGATFAFFIPLGVLALAWNLQRVPKAVAAPARVTEPVPTPEPAVEPRVKVRPLERTRERTTA